MNGNQWFAKNFDLTTQFGQKWIFAIILLLIFWFGGKILQTFVTKMARRKNLNKDFLHLIARIVKIVMVLLGSITALGTLGVDVSALVAGRGSPVLPSALH
jgi:small-conductance mechanosensitive channel